MTREEENNLQKVKEDYRIPYNDFVKILLDYQIKSRDKFLRNFCYLFRKADNDNNGLITDEEFALLVEIMAIYPNETMEENIIRLLDLADPKNNKVISYSDCVRIFSNEYFEEVNSEGEVNKISVLEKFAQDGQI